MSKSYCDITELGKDQWQLDFSYNEDSIEWLKSNLTWQKERSYDPDTNTSKIIGNRALDLVKATVPHYFELAHYICRKGSERVTAI